MKKLFKLAKKLTNSKKHKFSYSDHPFDLDYPLVNLGNDYLTLRDFCEGTFIFGQTGSGKTSGSFRLIANGFLNSLYGGIILTAKPTDLNDWEKFIERAGRMDDVIYLSKEKFDFIKYENERMGEGAGETENIVKLLFTLAELGDKGDNSREKFWGDQVKKMLRNVIDLLKYSEAKTTFYNIYKIIILLPNKQDEVSEELQNLIKLAEKKNGDKRDIILIKNYVLNEYPKLAEKTRTIITATFTGLADCLLRGKIGEILTSEEMSINPDEIIKNGKILIVDFDVKRWGEIGKVTSTIIKYIFQTAVERRIEPTEQKRPFFIFADEYQNFSVSYDNVFQATARSSKALTVYSSQNINYLYDELGKEKTKSLLENLNTFFLHKNSCSDTNNYVADKIIKVLVTRSNFSVGKQGQQGAGESSNFGYSEQKDYQVEPQDFSHLLKGGPENNYIVSAICYKSGDQFSNNKTFIKVLFNQKG